MKRSIPGTLSILIILFSSCSSHQNYTDGSYESIKDTVYENTNGAVHMFYEGDLTPFDYEIIGKVIYGDGRGKKLGFPTANLEAQEELIPLDGVYAAWVDYQDKRYAGMVNIGCRPTFPGAAPALEVHLIDFEEEIYGQTLHLHFVDRVRSEQEFSHPEALREQLFEDQRQILSILKEKDEQRLVQTSYTLPGVK